MPEVIRFQVYQPNTEHLDVRLLCKEEVSAAWLEEARSKIQARFGSALQISMQGLDDIEQAPNSKFRCIVSDVTPRYMRSDVIEPAGRKIPAKQ